MTLCNFVTLPYSLQLHGEDALPDYLPQGEGCRAAPSHHVLSVVPDSSMVTVSQQNERLYSIR